MTAQFDERLGAENRTMRYPTRKAIREYGLAVLLVGLALIIRLLLASLLGTRLPMLLFLPAVMLSAWFGGLGPGLLAIALSVLAGDLFLMNPADAVVRPIPNRYWRLGLFAIQALLFCPLIAGIRAARRRAEAVAQDSRVSEERYQRVLDSASEGIWTIDAAGKLEYVNRRMAEMFGYSVETMIGRTLFEFMDKAGRAEAEQRLERRKLGIGEWFDKHVDFHFLRKDRTDFWGLVTTTPILNDDGRFQGAMGMVTDVTERKRAEHEREQLLAREREARAEAQAANLAKDQFLAVLSHELRTPLMPVLVSVTALLDDPETPASLRPVLELTRRNVELEARLIDDLLDVTRISRGKLQLHREAVDAHALIHQAIEICRDEIGSGGLRLELDLAASEHVVDADPARLQQVYWNLIKNAVKFTPVGGRLSICSRNEENGSSNSCGKRLLVEVSDTGVGIEPELLPKIFYAFEQGESSMVRRFGGLGLGLAISRSVAEAHGGRLTALSAGKDQGATFLLELETVNAPLPPARAQPPAAYVTGSLPTLRILLAEDNEDTLRVMARLLRQRGHLVATANTLNAALKIAMIESFDLVVSDIGLPDGSGLELMRQLRARYDVKGIALSGFGMEEDIRKSQEAGFTAHMIKPVDARQLDEMIHRLAQGYEGDTLAT
jgi:PAS domain S-box-containing protein